jgi:hypothetical protein
MALDLNPTLRALLISTVLAADCTTGMAADKPQPKRTSENTLVVPDITYGTTPEGIVLDPKDDDCGTPNNLREAIGWKVYEPLEHIVPSDPGNVPGVRTLRIEIIDMLANKGGVFSGPKMLSIKGTLYKGDERIAGFTGTRSSMPFFPPRTSCNILGRSVEALAGDVGRWLLTPVDGAVLEKME